MEVISGREAIKEIGAGNALHSIRPAWTAALKEPNGRNDLRFYRYPVACYEA